MLKFYYQFSDVYLFFKTRVSKSFFLFLSFKLLQNQFFLQVVSSLSFPAAAFNSSANFLIYFLLNRRFQEELKKLFKCNKNIQSTPTRTELSNCSGKNLRIEQTNV
jgi:hypothetical protein